MNIADPAIQEALDTIIHFIRETRRIDPTPEQLAAALKRYFVLKEIADHIDLA
ncbi:MAG: hypothetical protein WBG37_15825 [Desulfobacterales bacterium]|jgi:hypothetical protein